MTILCFLGCANISEPYPIALSSGNVHFKKPVKTWKDFLEQNVVMQKFDYSCGAAALATLMQHYFKDDVTEREILEDIINQLKDNDINNRKEEGLSFLDLQKFAERRGYLAKGYYLKFSALPKLKGPVLVHLESSEYKHFAILRGVKEDRVFLADPSRGNIRMSIKEFAKEWSGNVFVLEKKGVGIPPKHDLIIHIETPLVNELDAVRRALYFTIQ